jgi:hypothetical protein
LVGFHATLRTACPVSNTAGAVVRAVGHTRMVPSCNHPRSESEQKWHEAGRRATLAAEHMIRTWDADASLPVAESQATLVTGA